MNRLATLIVAALFIASPGRAEATTIFLDTTPLQSLGGSWYLDFQLVDGDGAANNTVDITVLGLGGGTITSGASFIGGASGAAANYSLADSDFFNQALVPFTPGAFVTLDLIFSGNLADVFADTFSWAVLDGNFNPIVTDPQSLGASLVILLDGSGSLQRYAADPQYNSIIPQVVQAVPEPSALVLLLMAAAGGYNRRRRRHRP